MSTENTWGTFTRPTGQQYGCESIRCIRCSEVDANGFALQRPTDPQGERCSAPMIGSVCSDCGYVIGTKRETVPTLPTLAGVLVDQTYGESWPQNEPSHGCSWVPVQRDDEANVYPGDEDAAKAYADHVGSPVPPVMGVSTCADQSPDDDEGCDMFVATPDAAPAPTTADDWEPTFSAWRHPEFPDECDECGAEIRTTSFSRADHRPSCSLHPDNIHEASEAAPSVPFHDCPGSYMPTGVGWERCEYCGERFRPADMIDLTDPTIPPRDLLDALAEDASRRLGRTIDAGALARAIGEVARQSLAVESLAELIDDEVADRIARELSDDLDGFLDDGAVDDATVARFEVIPPWLETDAETLADQAALLAYLRHHCPRQGIPTWGDDWADGGTDGNEDTRPSGFFA